MLEQVVPRVPVGIAGQGTPVGISVGVALDELRAPAGLRVDADVGAAVGVTAGEGGASFRTSEDAAVAVGGAVVRAPEEGFD